MNLKSLALVTDILSAPFRAPNVAAVVAQMEKNVGSLLKVADANLAKADKLRDRADKLHQKVNATYRTANAAEDEAERALRVAERFTNLIR